MSLGEEAHLHLLLRCWRGPNRRDPTCIMTTIRHTTIPVTAVVTFELGRQTSTSVVTAQDVWERMTAQASLR